MRGRAFALLALVALIGAASAGRVPHTNEEASFDFKGFFGAQPEAVDRRRGGGGAFGEGKTAITSIYTVPPNLHEEFITRWRDVEDKALDEKRIIKFKLAKTASDNLYFTCYGEWESMEDFNDYATTNYVKDWKNWLEKNDIEVDMYPLRIPVDEEEEFRRRRSVQVAERRGGGGGRKGETAHVLIKFHVPPSAREDFVDTWRDVAESTYGESGNREYLLRSIATKNHHYLICGTWDSFEDYRDHLESRHMQRLKDFAAENEILWKVEPLINIGEQAY